MRGTSSSSSLSSSPPKFDAMEGSSASGKLPQLTEEPMEPEDLEDDDDFEMADETILSPCLCMPPLRCGSESAVLIKS